MAFFLSFFFLVLHPDLNNSGTSRNESNGSISGEQYYRAQHHPLHRSYASHFIKKRDKKTHGPTQRDSNKHSRYAYHIPLLRSLVLKSLSKNYRNHKKTSKKHSPKSYTRHLPCRTVSRDSKKTKPISMMRIPCRHSDATNKQGYNSHKLHALLSATENSVARVSIYVQPDQPIIVGPQYFPPEYHDHRRPPKPQLYITKDSMVARRSSSYKTEASSAKKPEVQYYKVLKGSLASRRSDSYKIDLPIKLARLLFPQITKKNTETIIRIYPDGDDRDGKGLVVSLAHRRLRNRGELGSNTKPSTSKRKCMFGMCPGCCPGCCSVCCPGGELAVIDACE